jgi:flavin-dependent dehydrogenase
LAARLAAEMVSAAFATACFSAEQLCAYECAWKSLLANELRLGLSFRKFYGWLGDRQMNVLLRYISRNGLKDDIQRKADFDWHGKLIMELASQTPRLWRPPESSDQHLPGMGIPIPHAYLKLAFLVLEPSA